MRKFGNLYSQYYDLLYQDKDYEGEVEYIAKLISKYCNNSNTLLDLGCGTGKHDELFCKKGYTVHGIDLSEDMLKIAETRRKGNEDILSFSQSNISDLNLNKKFDVIVSLFHVMSYQNTNTDLSKAFKVAKKHLNTGGIFIFDFWYGPAVLTDLPIVRVKRLENDNIKVTRVAEPVLHAQQNITDVNYNIFIENKNNKMRYLFDKELEIICKQVGLKIEKKLEWMSDKIPNFSSWNVVWIVRK
jgi:SAM-dependent methyltransferase